MSQKTEQYTVLARKYRPQTFADLVGQDALVRTLTNAIKQDRLAHAYLLTGIRGVGKTSTARIIAKSLTCDGPEANGKPTPEPCGVCENCKAITESRHVDVIEMDAASRTGVGDIREIIDNVHYHPSSARFKIYIIDEVHMLSKNAFNALLKTLEEPPQHVKFIFATTEVQKIPVTILSRCQRFDLPRISVELLAKHLGGIAKKEDIKIDDASLTVIASMAEGSVRDALSLLDQAIAHSGKSKQIDRALVESMLGLLGRDKQFAIFTALSSGDVKHAIGLLHEMYHAGADPLMVLQDLLELSHQITQAKVIPEFVEKSHLPEADKQHIASLAKQLEIPYLTRCWQMVLKGIQEAHLAPNTLMAVEMILVRLAYAANVPTPGDLVKELKDTKPSPAASAKPATHNVSPQAAGVPQPVDARFIPAAPLQPHHDDPKTFAEVVELFQRRQEPFLCSWLKNDVHLVHFESGRLDVRLTDTAPRDLPNRLMTCLKEWTGKRWMVVVSNEQGQQTIKQKENKELDVRKEKAIQSDEVQAVLKMFPEAKVISVEPVEEVVESGTNNGNITTHSNSITSFPEFAKQTIGESSGAASAAQKNYVAPEGA